MLPVATTLIINSIRHLTINLVTYRGAAALVGMVGLFPKWKVPPLRHSEQDLSEWRRALQLRVVPPLRQLEDTVGVAGCRDGGLEHCSIKSSINK